MNKQSWIRSWSLLWGLCFLLAVPSSLWAQSNTKSDDTAPASWDVRVQKMTTKGKLKYVAKIVKEARRVHNNMIESMKSARAKKDLVALECYSEKFSRAQALMFLMEKERSSFLKALADGKTEAANLHFVKLAQSNDNLKNIEVEAGACKGKAGIYDGKTRVDFEIPPQITNTDPTLPPWKEPIVYRPSNASNPY